MLGFEEPCPFIIWLVGGNGGIPGAMVLLFLLLKLLKLSIYHFNEKIAYNT